MSALDEVRATEFSAERRQPAAGLTEPAILVAEGPRSTGQRLARSLARFVRDHERVWLALAAITAFVALWEIAPALGWIDPFFSSSPSRITAAGRWLFANGFWEDIRVSAWEFTLGMGLAVLTGVPIGLALGWYGRLRAAFEPFVIALYTTPRVALMPLLILWLGIGIWSKVAVVYLGAVFPIIVTLVAGIGAIDDLLLRCAKAFGASDRQVFRTVALPSSVPFLVTGLRLGASRGLVGIVVGELIASTAGVGHMMSRAGATFQIDKVFVGVLVLIVVGVSLNFFLTTLERRFDAWRPQR